MVEVSITSKLNTKQINSLFTFLYCLADEISFSTTHSYHVDEDLSVELLNEYKLRCKDRHRELTELYEKKVPYLIKSLKSIGIDNEDEFNEYKLEIYQSEMSICKQMDIELQKLIEDNSTINYSEVFPEIKDYLIEIETHMFDSFSVSITPIDMLFYKTEKALLEGLLKVDSLFKPIFVNEEKHIYLTNPIFFIDKMGFAAINSKTGFISIVLDKTHYKIFKKLKIKHRKEVINDEDSQQQS